MTGKMVPSNWRDQGRSLESESRLASLYKVFEVKVASLGDECLLAGETRE